MTAPPDQAEITALGERADETFHHFPDTTSNRVFKGYDDIVAHCCDAWNGLMEQPWRIRSIGRRAWAEGF